ncbi:cytochrome ubiquinol oxidase subunit I [Paracoccus lutimaris]|uniref:Cytochrome bd-I ubiquinol oxidase subunit 1 apoprotein n=1 Tax=Paracoccus lutimaris TaxID=1490030 RepID=A0A368YXX0_9RHOB|nr:cytochrome ubiquinol oxidase subunit I [Paracoccus lutimaris]RCW85045.1 cytochrome bd-I ubiquinol oxidase subunit 1 apoprotein [Paracoccus lutimaris]
MEIGVVELSRLQFATTALFHFLFVPLTLGLSVICAIMETVYVMTDRPIWRQMTKFWGALFGINFAIGVATGITMEFQFGMNWAYYSHYVGDIFGAPLAMEGLMAFFMEATFVGLWFFGWDRLSKRAHLMVGWLVAIATNFSALWILIANGWMQFPVGAQFNPITMRMELTSFFDVALNPVAQAKFVHTVSAGYVCGSVFVLGVSSWYLLKGRHIQLARRSIAVASAFGLAGVMSVIVLGDESGYDASENQKMKMAAIEAMWETEPAPASFTLFGFPDQTTHETKWAIHIPYVMGLIGTRSLTQEIAGIDQLVTRAHDRVRNGIVAYDLMMQIQAQRDSGVDPALIARFRRHEHDLGYALLLKTRVEDPRQATEEQISQAAADTVPHVWPIFWAFRIMVGLGFGMLCMMGYFFWRASFRRMSFPRWALWLAVIATPAPWIAIEMGWIVAEYGRQPWTVAEVLPTALSVSHLSVAEVAVTLAGFVLLYSALFVVEMGLMFKYIRKGPHEDVALTEDWMQRHENRLSGRAEVAK